MAKKRGHIDISEILIDADLSEDTLEVPVSRATFGAAKAASALLVFAIMLQVVRINLIERTKYVAQAVDNAQNVRVITAKRGLIVDRYDNILATNERSFNAYLSPRNLPTNPAARASALETIARFFGINASKLAAEVAARERYFDDSVIIEENVPEESLVRIATANLPGVGTKDVWRRAVVSSLAFSHVLGYVTPAAREDLKIDASLTADDLVGRTGIEEEYDAALRGGNGVEIAFRDAVGRIEETKKIKNSEPGEAVRISIDKEFQEFLYARTVEELSRLGRRNGTAIAMNPYTGEVLALLNVPGYESNNIRRYLGSGDSVLFNRAIAGRYNPASTIKPLVAIAALAENIVTPDTEVFSAGYLEIPNPYNPKNPTIYRDWKAHGWVNLASAIARSSNVYFYTVGGGFKKQAGLGIALLKKWWQTFNLDKPTGIDLPGEQFGLLPDPTWKKERTGIPWVLGDTYNVSIGQGDMVITPLELLTYINTIANGGKIYQPKIALQVASSTLSPVVARDISKIIGVYRGRVEEGMLDAVRKPYGTAYLLHDVPLTIAGKTGSAQVSQNTKTNAFFVGYSIPEKGGETKALSLLILVENAREGSLNAVPIARDAFLWYYQNRIRPGQNDGPESR